jgi:putative DNA primase/helicase
MDARTPDPLLPMDLPKGIPHQVDRELWRFAHGMFPPGKEIGINDFESLAGVAANYVKARRALIKRGDVIAWLQEYAESCGLTDRFDTEKVQFALERAFDYALEEEELLNDPRLPEFSDDALALVFAHRHKDDLRFVAQWGKWLRFDGMCWREDTTMHVFDLSRAVCRDAALSLGDGEWSTKKALTSGKTVAAVERLAKSDRRLAATIDQWDAGLFKLNTPGAVVNLRTGTSAAPSPYDYLTKSTAVAPGGGCPIWKAFLARITNGNADLMDFLQRVSGYSLTGSTKEQALFFGYGTGANGKSVLIDTVANIMADYHATAAIDTFTASRNERHPTDIARLQGTRFVTAIETEKGRQWAEAKIKTLTGGDKITARFMHKDNFEFTPQFKLLIAGNHKPSLKSVDEAMRRRLNLIPFNVTIPAAERHKDLTEKLKAEWGGILSWMIDGCLSWQKRGLDPPAAVTEATDAYMDAEDSVANWLADECQRDARSFTNTSLLFASWKAWAERSGETVGSQNDFKGEMEKRRFVFQKRNVALGGRGFRGIRLSSDVPPP